MSNAPTVLLGLVPLFRAVVRSATDASTCTVTPDDSGTLFVSLSTAAIKYTLPAVADGAGKCFGFFAAGTTSQSVKVASTAANLFGGDGAANIVATSASNFADSCLVIGDGTYYYLLAFGGTWTIVAT